MTTAGLRVGKPDPFGHANVQRVDDGTQYDVENIAPKAVANLGTIRVWIECGRIIENANQETVEIESVGGIMSEISEKALKGKAIFNNIW